MKLAQEAGGTLSMHPPVPAISLFDPEKEAAEIIAIADTELRRARLRQRVTTLSPREVEDLQRAITELKSRQTGDNAWINDV